MAEIHKYILAVLVFSLFIVVGVGIWGSMIKQYDLDTTKEDLMGDNFSDVYDRIDDVYGIADESKANIMEGELVGEDESYESMIKGSYSAVRIKDTFGLVGSITTAVGGKIGIPTPIVDAAKIAFMLTIVFTIVYMVFRYK